MTRKLQRTLSSADNLAYKSRCVVWLELESGTVTTQPHIRRENYLGQALKTDKWNQDPVSTHSTDNKSFTSTSHPRATRDQDPGPPLDPEVEAIREGELDCKE